MMHPLLILAIGIAVVIGMMIMLKMNAFIALITAAMIVSVLAPGPTDEKISRVAAAFGEVVGGIGIVIALAAVIGKCLMDSGAADRIVRAFLRALGEKRASMALMSSGFVLSVPVFFDTVFYLLVPLARSLWRKTRKNYILYVTAIACGGAVTHTLVPPTPGPLAMADLLHVDLGMMILMGTLIGAPTAVVGLFVCKIMNQRMDMPMRPYPDEVVAEPLADHELPPLSLSLLPVVLPVVLISLKTVADALAVGGASATETETSPFQELANVVGNPNLALLLSAAIAMFLMVRYRSVTLGQLAQSVETALMSGGVIILITAGGGAFGRMLSEAGIRDIVQGYLGPERQFAGVVILLVGFTVASVMKFAQGSGTVSMITTASIFGAMGLTGTTLGFHPVYLATAIGAGSLVGSWMNDSGFWIFARMSGLTEVETLRSWTVLLAILGATALGLTLVFATALPLVATSAAP
jgi:gluconate:H+ symporter, GntP family